MGFPMCLKPSIRFHYEGHSGHNDRGDANDDSLLLSACFVLDIN